MIYVYSILWRLSQIKTPFFCLVFVLEVEAIRSISWKSPIGRGSLLQSQAQKVCLARVWGQLWNRLLLTSSMQALLYKDLSLSNRVLKLLGHKLLQAFLCRVLFDTYLINCGDIDQQYWQHCRKLWSETVAMQWSLQYSWLTSSSDSLEVLTL